MLIKPMIKNFVVYQGTTFMMSFQCDVPGYVLDDQCIAAMHIRKDISSVDIIDESTTENGKIIISPLDKTVSVKISATETSQFEFEKAVYDLEIEFSNGDRFRIVQGSLSLSLEVTRQ